MKKILHIFIAFIFLSFAFFGGTKQAYAQSACTSAIRASFSMSNWAPSYGGSFLAGVDASPVNPTFSGLTANSQYVLTCQKKQLFGWSSNLASWNFSANASGTGTVNISNNSVCWEDKDDYRLMIVIQSSGASCLVQEYEVLDQSEGVRCVTKSATNASGQSGCFEQNEQINWSFEVVNGDGTPYTDELMVRTTNVYGGGLGAGRIFSNPSGVITGTDTAIELYEDVPEDYNTSIVYTVFAEADIQKQIASCTLYAGNVKQDMCTEDDYENGATPGVDTFSLCDQIPEQFEEQKTSCKICTEGEGENEANKGVWTAIGCIKREPQAIMQRLITVGLGISGGVALLTFLAAGFIFSTSQGDPKAYGKAKEMMTAAIVGIIFVIFSVTILQFIGYEVLKIPGFGG